MSLRIAFVAGDLKMLQKWLDKAHASLEHTEPLYRTLGNLVVKDAIRTFAEGGFHGTSWAPLAPATYGGGHPSVAGRRRGVGKILHPTGAHLRGTIAITEISSDSVEIGTPNAWAHIHNEGANLQGTAFGDITIPKRTFLALSPELEEELMKAVAAYLGEAIS